MGLIDFNSLQLIFLVLLNFSVGITLLVVGHRLSRQGDWLSAIGIFGLIIGFFLAWGEYVTVGMTPVTALVEWWTGGSPDEQFYIGLLHDSYSLTACTLFCLLSLVFLGARQVYSDDKRIKRVYGALPISVGGACLCWISATPWLSFLGTLIVILGGFIGCGSYHYSESGEATWASRYLRDHFYGILVSFLGACILLSIGVSLRWDQVVSDYFNPHLQLGMSFFLLGLFLHFRPFPFIGWIHALPTQKIIAHLFLTQILPIWSAYAFIFRSYPLFKATGILDFYGWLSLCLALIGYGVSLFQKEKQKVLVSGFSSSALLSVSFLFIAGERASFLFLVATTLSALMFGYLLGLDSIKTEKPKIQSSSASIVSVVFIFIAAAMSSGTVGFVSSGSFLIWMRSAHVNGTLLSFASVIFFVHAFFVWTLAWRLQQSSGFPRFKSGVLVSMIALIILSLGTVWTGTVSGGLFSDGQDAFLFSFSDLLFGSQVAFEVQPNDSLNQALPASSLFWAIFLLALGFAYAARTHWESFFERFSKLSNFISHCFYIDKGAKIAGRFLVESLYRIERVVSERFFLFWIPSKIRQVIQYLSARGSAWDHKLDTQLVSMAFRITSMPAKMIQLFQSGDLQWYLILCFATVIAVILHFMGSII